MENPEVQQKEPSINEQFPYESLMVIHQRGMGEEYPWYADFAKYLAGGIMKKGLTHQHRKKFQADIKYYIRDDPYMF
jgi:hypothetical protein